MEIYIPRFVELLEIQTRYSSRTYANVRIIIAVIRKRKAINSLNSGITSSIPEPPMMFFVAITEGIMTGIQMGMSRKERSKVLPSENITSPETKEPAKESPTAPKKQISKSAGNLPLRSRLRKMMEKGMSTHSTRISSATP